MSGQVVRDYAAIVNRADRADACWSLDFVSDTFTDGRRFRVPVVVGDDTRERLALTADTSLSGLRGKTDAVAIAPITRRSAKVMDAYLADRKVIKLDGPPFRTRRGVAYTKNSLAEDFRDIRALVWPGDSRTLMDMRRSGALEASAGAVDPKALSDVMGNTIAQSRALQRIDTPAQTASTVPEARNAAALWQISSIAISTPSATSARSVRARSQKDRSR